MTSSGTKIDFITDPSEREKLSERIEQIDSIVNKIDFYIDGNGEILNSKSPGFFDAWKPNGADKAH